MIDQLASADVSTELVFPQEFTRACQYRVEHKQPRSVRVLDEELWRASGVVYAPMYAGRIVYVGVTDGPLSKRIGSHLRGLPTSAYGLAARYREWVEGKEMTILAYKPPPVPLLGRDVEVHRAIEAHLIELFGRPRRMTGLWLDARSHSRFRASLARMLG